MVIKEMITPTLKLILEEYEGTVKRVKEFN